MDQHVAERLAQLKLICRQRGLPLTTQRRSVLEVLLQRSDHPTADQVYATVQATNPQISRRTVYRVLDTLSEWGLVRRVHHPGASARYDAKTHRHHHLVCNRCGKIVDLESPTLDNLSIPNGLTRGFDVRDFSVQLMGTCPECRRRRKK